VPSSQNSPLLSVALPHTLTGAETHAPAPVVASFEQGEPRLHLLAVRRATAAHAVVGHTLSCGSTLPLPQTQIFVHTSAAPALGELHK